MYHNNTNNNIFIPLPRFMFPIIKPNRNIHKKSSVIIEEIFTEESDKYIKNDENNKESYWIVIKKGTIIIRILNNTKLDELLTKSFSIK